MQMIKWLHGTFTHNSGATWSHWFAESDKFVADGTVICLASLWRLKDWHTRSLPTEMIAIPLSCVSMLSGKGNTEQKKNKSFSLYRHAPMCHLHWFLRWIQARWCLPGGGKPCAPWNTPKIKNGRLKELSSYVILFFWCPWLSKRCSTQEPLVVHLAPELPGSERRRTGGGKLCAKKHPASSKWNYGASINGLINGYWRL